MVCSQLGTRGGSVPDPTIADIGRPSDTYNIETFQWRQPQTGNNGGTPKNPGSATMGFVGQSLERMSSPLLVINTCGPDAVFRELIMGNVFLCHVTVAGVQCCLRMIMCLAGENIPFPGIVCAASSRAFWPLPGYIHGTFHIRVLLFQAPSEEHNDTAQHLVNATPLNFEPFKHPFLLFLKFQLCPLPGAVI